MSYAPIIPSAGLNGWQFLQRTMEKQTASHASTSVARRDEAYFRENIGKISSAEELVKDRRLLQVTLSAFGMSDDLPNRAFIQRVLESPTREPGPGEQRSFVHRLADKRYLELAKAFGFGDRAAESTQTLRDPALPAAGRDGLSTRLAASMQRDLSALAGSDIGDEATWALIVSTPSLRMMFEAAYDLPEDFESRALGDQINALRSHTEEIFGSGSAAQFVEAAALSELASRYINGFADDMLANFHARQFEEAVGQQDNSLRLALALQRDLAQLAGSDQSESGKWYRVLGTPSMRQVFETAFQLPSSFASLDLDRQVDVLRARTERAFGKGDIAQFSDPTKLDKLVRQFFVGEQLSEIRSVSSQSAALTLLQSAQASMAAFRQR